jgi:hypothetical protein
MKAPLNIEYLPLSSYLPALAIIYKNDAIMPKTTRKI